MIGKGRTEEDRERAEPAPDPGAGSEADSAAESRDGGNSNRSRRSRRERLRQIPILPSLLTLGNLFCGFLSIAYMSDSMSRLVADDMAGALAKIEAAAWVIFLAMIFDALDGRVARTFGQESDFGGELDSLADMVSFGLAPAFMVKVLVEDFYEFYQPRVALGFSAVYVLCAALRLARYNAESDPQEEGNLYFHGLPSPGAAGMVAGMVLVYATFQSDWENAEVLLGVLAFIAPVLGILMFSRIPYPHVMNRFFRGPKPMKYLVYVGILAGMALVFQSLAAAVAGLLFVYVLSGPGRLLFRLLTGRAAKNEFEIFD